MPPRKRSSFTWDARASRYRRRGSGQFVAKSTVIRAFELAIAKNSRSLRTVSEQLRNGEISLREWQRQVAVNVKDAHLYAAAIARGGRLSQSDLGRVGHLLRERYLYLSRFSAQIATGEQPLNGRFMARTASYLLHSRQSRHEAERIEMFEVQGLQFEQNILHEAEHCDGCLAAAALGPVPIGVLPAIGQRDCLSSCQCQIVYS